MSIDDELDWQDSILLVSDLKEQAIFYILDYKEKKSLFVTQVVDSKDRKGKMYKGYTIYRSYLHPKGYYWTFDETSMGSGFMQAYEMGSDSTRYDLTTDFTEAYKLAYNHY